MALKTEESSQGDRWKTTCKRYVGYIDIMGFKDMVARMSHEEIYDIMKDIGEARRDNETMDLSHREKKLVSTTSYSDSIIVYSKDDSFEALDTFVDTMAGLSQDLIGDRVPFKGAIAFGLMTLDTENSIFFGQPLIDSYLLQEEILFLRRTYPRIG